MPRSGPNGTYTLPGAQATQVAGTPIPSAVNNQGWSDAEQTFNTIQPVPYGGTGVADGKPLDNVFGVKNSSDITKVGVFSAANIQTATTRSYDLPNESGTLALTSDIEPSGRVRAATTANITISTALNSGDALDGVTLADGDLVLVKNQTSQAENGVYVVGAVPARSSQFNTWLSFLASTFTVAEGTVNAATTWISTTPKAGTLGTTAIPIRPQPRIWEPIETRNITASSAEGFIDLSPFVMIRITGYLAPSVNGATLRIRTSSNNGSSYDSGASDYVFQYDRGSGATADAGGSTDSYGLLTPFGVGNSTGYLAGFTTQIYAFNKTNLVPYIVTNAGSIDSAGVRGVGDVLSTRSSLTARNAFQIFPSSGTITGLIYLEGIRG